MFVDDNQEQTVLPLQSLDCSGTAAKTHDVIEANGGVGNASGMFLPHIIQVTSLNNFSYLGTVFLMLRFEQNCLFLF